MFECPFTNSGKPCDVQIELEVYKEAEREALEMTHELQSEVRYYIQRVKLLESVLEEYGIDIPYSEDNY